MKIKVNDIEVHCRLDGSPGSPWLIFCNSLATNLSMWEREAEHFARRFRVLRFDQRGHGQTDAPTGPYSMEWLLADVVSLMDRLGIESADVCGLSLGGATAMGLAQRYPSRVKRAVICSTPCASTAAGAKAWEERAAAVVQGGMAAVVASTLERWFTPDALAANPPHVDVVRQMILATPASGYIGCAAALADHDFRSQIGSVKCPVLYVVGEDDAPRLEMRKMHQELPGSRFCELEGAGHICNLEKPAAFIEAVDEFLV
jgi:3-oxoadipate enol-lactonase